jgi:hypothetical protein
MAMAPNDELNKKAEEIEAIHNEALQALKGLKDDENRLIEAFINNLKEKRLAELRAIFEGRAEN